MKLFVWDLHGVLEKGNEDAAIDVTNILLKRFGYAERLSMEDKYKLYGQKWYKYFEYALPNESHERHLELQDAGFNFTVNEQEYVAKFFQPNDHVFDVLKSISERHDQILISNTEPKSLDFYVDRLKLRPFFGNKMFAADGHKDFSKNTKAHTLSEYARGKNYDTFVVIGDSVSDMKLLDICKGVGYFYTHPGRHKPAHGLTHTIYPITDLREVLKEI